MVFQLWLTLRIWRCGVDREQLALFEIPTPTPTPKPRKQSQAQKLEGLAEEILAQAAAEGIDPMELVAELQFRELCQALDQWPRWLAKQFVVKLMRRYFRGS